MNHAPRQKKCKGCGLRFQPTRPFEVACSPLCAVNVARGRVKAEARQRLTDGRRALMTRTDYLRLAQAAFNAYVRARDAGLPCISCGRFHQGKWDAGHYRTVKREPEGAALMRRPNYAAASSAASIAARVPPCVRSRRSSAARARGLRRTTDICRPLSRYACWRAACRAAAVLSLARIIGHPLGGHLLALVQFGAGHVVGARAAVLVAQAVAAPDGRSGITIARRGVHIDYGAALGLDTEAVTVRDPVPEGGVVGRHGLGLHLADTVMPLRLDRHDLTSLQGRGDGADGHPIRLGGSGNPHGAMDGRGIDVLPFVGTILSLYLAHPSLSIPGYSPPVGVWLDATVISSHITSDSATTVRRVAA